MSRVGIWNGNEWKYGRYTPPDSIDFSHGEEIQTWLVGVPEGDPRDPRLAADLSASGSITTSSNGQVIEELDISGNITIEHDNVIIRKCRITGSAGAGSGYYVIDNGDGKKFTIEDCTINGNYSKNKAVLAGPKGMHMKRCDIYGSEDAVYLSSNIDDEDLSYPDEVTSVTPNGANHVIEDSLFRGNASIDPDPHSDGLQIDGGTDIVVRRLKILCYQWDGVSGDITGDPENPGNYALILTQNSGSPRQISRVYIDSCYLDGGNFLSGLATDGLPIADVTFVDNKYGRQFRFGPHNGSGTNITYTNSTWASSGVCWRGGSFDRWVIEGEPISTIYTSDPS